MVSASSRLSKIELALLRRLPFHVRSAYIPALGQSIAYPQCAASSFQDIFIRQIYRPAMPLPVGATVVDLGVNLGMFCMYINGLLRAGRIHCFEANPTLFPHLKKNVEAVVRRGNTVELSNVAIAGESGFLELFTNEDDVVSVAPTAFRDVSKFPDREKYKPVRVASERLPRLVPGRIDFLKCDIEGAEYDVLDDDVLTTDRLGQAAIEFHDVSDRFDRLSRIVETAYANGFSLAFQGSGMMTPPALLDAVRHSGEEAVIITMCAKDLRSPVSGS